jgi:hypothetical protein
MLFAREVDSGGLSQFFWNSSGIYWRHVVAALELLGADQHLVAPLTALKIFPEGVPSLEQSERKEVLDRINASQQAEIRAVEDVVHRAGGFEGLLQPLWKRYIDLHPDEFFK